MEASGGADPRRRERESLPLLNGAPLFGAAQTLAHHRHPNNAAGEEPESSSNPDPVSFAFAASSGPPAMTSPVLSAGSKPKPAVRYRECLRNHAASVGGSVFDGCGEFMPAGEEGTLEALKCAACDCHRNFHRKETTDGDGSHHFTGPYRRSSGGPLAALQLPSPPALPSPSMVHHPSHSHHARHFSSLSIVPPMSVAYGGGGSAAAAAAAAGTESSSEDLNLFGTPTPTPGSGGCYFGSSNSSVKKRSRTKFTQEQKEKMMEFAEKIGWKMQRQSDEEVERFCADVGVKRQVFKVWMHNNKNNKSSSSSKPLDQFHPPSP